jgi:sarcosine oxidase subunit beta
MTRTAEIVIIGGGVNGLATAYNLCRMGMKNIVVLEKGYIGCGASGRCGAGIRQQWGLDENVILARESVKVYEHLSEELNFNIFFRQGGYLMLLFDERELNIISKTVPRHNELGVPTRLLTPVEIGAMVPGITVTDVLAGAFCPTDGTAYPYAVLWGYAEALKKRGVEIHTRTEVTRVSKERGEHYKIESSMGAFTAPRILNVAGAFSKDIAAMLGIAIPTQPFRHEIAVTEPLKAFLEPMVISPKKGYYFSQSMRGEIVGGIGDAHEQSSYYTGSSPDFLIRYAAALREVFPALGKARIMRQWAGLYDVTPDARPILGGVSGVDGYYHACGFSGHGFMLAPAISKLMAELITSGTTSISIEELHLERFKERELTRDPYVVG